MGKITTRKVGLAMRTELYQDLSKLAKDNEAEKFWRREYRKGWEPKV